MAVGCQAYFASGGRGGGIVHAIRVTIALCRFLGSGVLFRRSGRRWHLIRSFVRPDLRVEFTVEPVEPIEDVSVVLYLFEPVTRSS